MATQSKSKTVGLLEDLVTRSKKAYYAGKTLRVRTSELPEAMRDDSKFTEITDKVYDKIEDQLRKLSPKSTALSVGAVVAPVRKKIKLAHYLGSLYKCRSEEDLDKWKAKYPGPYSVSEKLDGASLLLRYLDGVFIGLFSRGDGVIGQDISHLRTHIDVPQKIAMKGEVWLRGEGLISLARFKAWSDQFKNPRNMATGLTNRKTPHEANADLQVLIYRMLEPALPIEKALDKAHALGFDVPRERVFRDVNVEMLRKLMKKWRTRGKFEIDGLVIAQNKLVIDKASLGGPANAIAFKDWEQDDSAECRVSQVEWRLSRHGLYIPRIHIDPQDLRGVTVTHTAGKNAKFIVDNGIGVGAIIRLRRSGDVIPDFRPADVVKRAKVALPKDAVWDANEVNLLPRAASSGQKDGMVLKKLQHTFVTIGIEQLKVASLTKLVDAGFADVASIVRLARKPQAFADAYGSKTGATVAAQIREVHEQPLPMAMLMDASNCFGRAIGTRKAQLAVTRYPNLLSLAAELDEDELTEKLLDVPGYQQTTAQQVAEGLPRFAKWLTRTGFQPARATKKTARGPLRSQVFCFTGFRDKDAAARIVALGGEYTDSLTSKVTVLVYSGDPNSTKCQKAEKNGIRLLDRDKFGKLLDKASG